MSYRTFQDQEGQRWEVWLVSPSAAERRRVERRSPSNNANSLHTDHEKRITPERRRNPSRKHVEVTPGFENGWLCFESGEGEKRRLVPVPDLWAQASNEQLWQLCRQATQVMKCGPN